MVQVGRGRLIPCVVRLVFFFQAEDGIRDVAVTGVQTCALPISVSAAPYRANGDGAETTHRGHQLSMTSTVLIRCIRLLPGCESRLKSRLRHVAQAPGEWRTRTSGSQYLAQMSNGTIRLEVRRCFGVIPQNETV